MAGKKDRRRFTLRLNEKDPAHAEVICVLEQPPPHSIGRFIANAVLHYVHCSEMPDTSVGLLLNRNAIEAIVRDILKRQDITVNENELGERMLQQEQTESMNEKNKQFSVGQSDGNVQENDVNESTRALIQNTLSAFRSNR